MKHLTFFTLLWLVFGIGRAIGQNPEFLAGIEDLPLMEELEEVKSATLVFDKPDGRIIEAAAIGTVAVAKVQSFYHSTLPALGWTKTGHLHFLREGESLSLSILQNNDKVQVLFSIMPHTE
tara:strand:- start:5190 stop:5552 length:363 start_codon:yes stop_codon:yes gene_type:complete